MILGVRVASACPMCHTVCKHMQGGKAFEYTLEEN